MHISEALNLLNEGVRSLQDRAERPFLFYVHEEYSAMKIRRGLGLSLFFTLIDFIGGAVRYWRWWPSNTAPYSIVSGILCPLCPNIDSLGANWEKFLSRAVLGGLLNIVPALLVGWLVVEIFASHNRSRASIAGITQLFRDRGQ